MLQIVFHGQNALAFSEGIEPLIEVPHRVLRLPDVLTGSVDQAAFAAADVVVGISLKPTMPAPAAVRLFQVPAAGTDAVDQALLPRRAALCNCHGHERAITEYVLAALLRRQVPFERADADLRAGRWTLQPGRPGALRNELGDQTIGLLGFGHIGRSIAQAARALGMRVHACNRSPVDPACVDQSWPLEGLEPFMASADVIVVSLPLTTETQGLVGPRALGTMRTDALLINVGRGPVIDEAALYAALKSRSIGGAVIDTWYCYPDATRAECAPSRFDFSLLDNVIMTPHLSGWTHGTVRRRRETVADNINRLARGQALLNVVLPATE